MFYDCASLESYGEICVGCNKCGRFDSNTYNKIKQIAKTYGYEAQSRQCMEECVELIQAINKFWRKCQLNGLVTLNEIKAGETQYSKLSDEKGYQDLVEELADIQIMIWQMAYLLNADLKPIIEQKLDRQIKRIEEGS